VNLNRTENGYVADTESSLQLRCKLQRADKLWPIILESKYGSP